MRNLVFRLRRGPEFFQIRHSTNGKSGNNNTKNGDTPEVKPKKTRATKTLQYEPKPPYVIKARLFDYWQHNDKDLEAELERSQGIIMVDKDPLIEIRNNRIHLVEFQNKELRSKLREYGLEIGTLNSVLLDVVEPKENFIDYFQALVRWYKIYQRCPSCATPLRHAHSKSFAQCTRCNRVYYPHITPVAITLIHDESNENCLLVRHKNDTGGVYTAVAGFSIPGESIEETARREIAEELGIEVQNIKNLGLTQCWPMPNCSLMNAFTAVADKKHKLEIYTHELESAMWFTRAEIKEVIEMMESISFKKINEWPNNQSTQKHIRYIPPQGAIAHQIIKQWVLNK